MRASIEYLFAGLSVVSTPSLGGRDYYFDDEYCIIAAPNPRSIRGAVEALITRAVPREYVRAKTLARVEVDRARYIAFVQGLIDRARGSAQFADRFSNLIPAKAFCLGARCQNSRLQWSQRWKREGPQFYPLFGTHQGGGAFRCR